MGETSYKKFPPYPLQETSKNSFEVFKVLGVVKGQDPRVPYAISAGSCLPPRMWKCRCLTDWQASSPQLVMTR